MRSKSHFWGLLIGVLALVVSGSGVGLTTSEIVTAADGATGPELSYDDGELDSRWCTGPWVVCTSPGDGATDVPVDTLVMATFSEAIDEATIILTLDTVLDPVSGSISYSDTTATFTPDANLHYSTPYAARIQASDLAGNPMPEAYTWSFTTAQPPEVWVDDDYHGGRYNDGHTWRYDAFVEIQDGIDAVASPGIVHVAAGYYLENITLKDGVQVLGTGASVTTIDGGGAGSVVTAINVGPDTALGGFTITGGNADNGGGMHMDHSSPTVSNNVFQGNSAKFNGGGIDIYSYSSPIMRNNIIRDNTATGGGGIAVRAYSSLIIIGNIIHDNSAVGYASGDITNYTSCSTMANNIIGDNNVDEFGGGVYMRYSSLTLVNSTIVNNSAFSGGGVYREAGSSPTIFNCIIWGNGDDLYNCTAIYSNIEDSDLGEGNISADPLFVDPTSGDYHLQAGSPCIDAGTNAWAPTQDLEGNTRPIDGDGDGTLMTDMGAYEYVPSPDTTSPTVISTSPGDGATDMPVDTPVTATFSEAIDEATIVFTLDTVLDTVSGSTSYSDTTATFTPDANLDYSTTYAASIKASDLAGNPMAEAYTWSFTTAESVLPGDANGDGVVNIFDITYLERILAGLEDETSGADANQDGVVNSLDITKVERIIVGLD